MKILFYDCFAGISGDMNLAAMIDLGVEPDYLRSELSKLSLDHEFELQVRRDARKGIVGTRVDVVLKGEAHHAHAHTDEPHGHAHDHPQHPHHGHSHHDHAGHDHAAQTHPEERGSTPHAHDHHAHRNLKNIEAIIAASSLGEEVRRTSLTIFRKIAEAEAKVHGKDIHEVHFHEVGATDSIVDIVGAAICFHRLGVDAVWASPVELGGGFVRCAHGLMPVPAPATVEILKGIPTTRGAVKQETTTPTGAAILAALVSKYTESPELVMDETAYGIGHRDTDIPNVLRVHLARPAESSATASAGGTMSSARLLQCNIDDMTPEMLGVVMDLLMESGAMDVHFTPILMKKGRPATCISLLCSAQDEEKFKMLLFRHTTTLGIKSFPLQKTVLATAFERLDTPLGSVTMKNALLDGEIIRSKPELEDCREISRRQGIPLAEVYYHIGKSRK